MKELDFYFPFLIFAYGIMVVLVTETPYFARLGREKMASHFERTYSHKTLGWISFFLGGLWSIQNIWL